jgi:hypothetical protein
MNFILLFIENLELTHVSIISGDFLPLLTIVPPGCITVFQINDSVLFAVFFIVEMHKFATDG